MVNAAVATASAELTWLLLGEFDPQLISISIPIHNSTARQQNRPFLIDFLHEDCFRISRGQAGIYLVFYRPLTQNSSPLKPARLSVTSDESATALCSQSDFRARVKMD